MLLFELIARAGDILASRLTGEYNTCVKSAELLHLQASHTGVEFLARSCSYIIVHNMCSSSNFDTKWNCIYAPVPVHV